MGVKPEQFNVIERALLATRAKWQAVQFAPYTFPVARAIQAIKVNRLDCPVIGGVDLTGTLTIRIGTVNAQLSAIIENARRAAVAAGSWPDEKAVVAGLSPAFGASVLSNTADIPNFVISNDWLVVGAIAVIKNMTTGATVTVNPVPAGYSSYTLGAGLIAWHNDTVGSRSALSGGVRGCKYPLVAGEPLRVYNSDYTILEARAITLDDYNKFRLA